MRYVCCLAYLALTFACASVAYTRESVRLTSDEVQGIVSAFKLLKAAAPKDERAAFIVQHLRRYYVDINRQDGRFVVWFGLGPDLKSNPRALEGHFLFQREPFTLIKISYGR